MSEPQSESVVRYYTRSRRIRQLIGSLPDGTRIPGGPYTIPQVLGGFSVIGLGAATMSIWGAGMNALLRPSLLFVAAYGAMWGLGRLRLGNRSPLALTLGAVAALRSPRSGRYDGRPVALRVRPTHLTHRAVIGGTTRPDEAWATTEGRATTPTVRPPALPPAPLPDRAIGLTAVQALLVAAAAEGSAASEGKDGTECARQP